MFVDGWTTLQNKKPKNKWAGQQWPYWEDSGDWACHLCDPFVKGQLDTYEGNYGSDKWCRGCLGPKKETQHMLMSVRKEKIKAGTLLSREEARAKRLEKQAGINTERWVYDWNKGWRKDKATGEGEIREKRIELLEFKEKLSHDLIDKKITQDEFEKQIKTGPPQGNKEGPKIEEVSGALGEISGRDADMAADATVNPWLGKSWKEINNTLKYRKNNLRRMKNDSGTDKATLERLQQMVNEAEAAQIAITPPEARISQFDQQITDAQWAKEEAEYRIIETNENAAYWEAKKTDDKENLNTATANLENLRKQKNDFMMKVGGNASRDQPGQHLQLDEAAFEIMQSADVQNNPEDKEMYQSFLKLNDYIANKLEQKAWENWEALDSEEEESDDEEDAVQSSGMVDIRHLAAKLPTQSVVAQGSVASADPTAGTVFSQAEIDALNKFAAYQDEQVKIEQDQGRGKTAEDKKAKKEKNETKERKPKVLTKNSKDAAKPRGGKKETGTTPTKDDKDALTSLTVD